MEPVKRASAVITEAEAELRGIVSEAAAAGDYESVMKIAAWARALEQIVFVVPRASVRTEQNSAMATRANHSSARAAQVTPSRPDDQYPRFFRDGDRLVRVAWSKSEKQEYEHKAQLAVLDALSVALAQKGKDGRVFSTDELLPVRNDDGNEVPRYQVYAWIGLLRQVGLIEQHGRRGYSMPHPSEFRTAAEEVWQNLPEK